MKTKDKANDIAKEIKKLADAMRRFRDGPLNERCLLVLLKDVTGLPLATIKTVLEGASELDTYFLKGEGE